MLYQIEILNHSNNYYNINNYMCLFVHFLQGATVAYKLKLQKHFDVNEVSSEC